MSELANDKHNNKDIIKKDFNNYVAQAINNHETEPLFKTDGNSFVVDDKNYTFGQLDKKRAGNQVIKKLWESFVKEHNIKVDNEDTFELSLLNTNCILNSENRNGLYKLFDDAKNKVLDEQEKNLEKEKKRNDIKQKLSNQVDVLINNIDIYKFENNYITWYRYLDRHCIKYLLSSKDDQILMIDIMHMLQRKLTNNNITEAKCEDWELDEIAKEVVESKKNKIEEKIASDIEKRKQVLKDFNGFVSCEIDKHNDENVVYKYNYEKQKFYLHIYNEFYDTVDDLETALIKIYAQRYSEHKNTEKPYNPFDPNPYSVNVDSIEVLDDITKRKLDDRVNMIFKDRLDELSNIFNSSRKSDVHKFISNLLGDDWRLKIRDRNKDIIIKEIKKVILKNFIEKLEGPDETKYHAIPYDFLGSVSISPIYLDDIFGNCLWGQFSRASNTRMGFHYYIENDIDSNNFDAKFDELKQEYGEKNISPVAACYFLSAIKKDDLTPERVNKVWNEVNTDLYHYLSTGTDNRLMTLVNNLLDGNFPSNEYLDIFIFCIRLDINFKYMDDDRLNDCLYNMIYGIITNSEKYKQANGNKEREAVAIKNFFNPNGFFKKFWITLAEFDANNHPSHKLFYSKNLTMRKMKELAYNPKNEYSRKLNNLLQDHDIYISPTTEKTKDDKEKEVDQICIKVDSYKAIQTQAKKDFDEYMKKVIYDLKNDQNVKYDWAEGTLTYNEKIIYNFKNVKFYDEEGKKFDAANETWKFVALVAEFYCQDHKLPSYEFDLALFPNDMREIQKIIGEKQQAKIKELIDGFSKFVDQKIENHKNQRDPLFRLKKDSIFDYKFDPQDEIDFVMVNDLANEIVEQFITEYFRNKFYINDNAKRLIQKEIEEQENKLKTLFNNAIKEHVEKNKLNYEYDAREDYWKEIPEKNIKNMVGKSEQLANQKNDLEDKKSNNNLSNKELLINLNQHSKIENKIEDKITNNETINEKELEASVNGALQKAKKSLAEKKNGINNETKSVKNDIIIQENKQIEVEIDEKQNNKQDNGNQYSNSIENSNTDENKNQNEIEIKNMEKNNENEDGTKNDTSEKLSNQDKIVEDNDKIDKNKIEENSNNTESQTSDLADKNNQDQSGTKNKGLIKFLTVLKWIALIGFILTLAMTVLSIFIASLSAAIVKFVIAAVVLFFVFVMSKLLVSCLSNKKPKENENPYQKQFDTDFGKIKNQNEFDINKSKHESDINQIGEPKSTISSVIEN